MTLLELFGDGSREQAACHCDQAGVPVLIAFHML